MYHVSAQGIDERMINVHYYYYLRAAGQRRGQRPLKGSGTVEATSRQSTHVNMRRIHPE